MDSDTFPLATVVPLPWRVALRTRTAAAIYTLGGAFLSYVLSHKLHIDVSTQLLIQSVSGTVGIGAWALALLGRRQAPLQDVKRLQKIAAKQSGGK